MRGGGFQAGVSLPLAHAALGILLALGLGAAGAGSAVAQAQAQAQTESGTGAIRPWFGPYPDRPGLAERFVAFVAGARERLDGAFYEFRHDRVVDALVAAHQRGVAVRLVVDDDHYWQHDETGERLGEAKNPFVARLLAAGIPVRHDDDRSGLMHDKFAIRDGATVWTGSFNPTDTCDRVNRNHAVEVDSPELAGLYQAEFDEMFEDGRFGIRSPTSSEHEVVVGGSRVEAWFGPEDDPNARIAELLTGAREEVLFMQFAFTASNLSGILVEKKAANPKMRIQGVFDRILHRSTGPYGEFARLTQAGIPVIVHAGTEGKMHHKAFVIDADGEDPVVVLGSANASENGNRVNDENVLVVRDRAVARAFKAEFEGLFGRLSQVRALLSVQGMAIAGERVPRADLVLLSGGKAIEELRIELPARWKTDEDPRLSAWRNEKDVGREVGLSLEDGRRIVVPKAAMAAYGVDAYLRIRFQNLRLPELAGGYSLYVTARAAGSRAWHPLETQPTFEVLEGRSAATFETLFRGLRAQEKRVAHLERLPTWERQSAQEALARTRSQARVLLVEALSEDDLEPIRLLLAFVATLDPDEGRKFSASLAGDKTVGKALKGAVNRGVAGAAEALAELAR